MLKKVLTKESADLYKKKWKGGKHPLLPPKKMEEGVNRMLSKYITDCLYISGKATGFADLPTVTSE